MERRIVRLRLLSYFGLTLALIGGVLFSSLFAWSRHADLANQAHEEKLVGNAYQSALRRYEVATAALSTWDEAVRHLDNSYDIKWAEAYLGANTQQALGADLTMVLSPHGKVLYASKAGRPQPPEQQAEMAHALLPAVAAIRRAEAQRGVFLGSSASGDAIAYPIQVSGSELVSGKPFVFTASLIQPSFGRAMPREAQAPIIIVGKIFDQSSLKMMSENFLLSDVRLQTGSRPPPPERAHVTIRNIDGATIGAVTWRPEKPGSDFLYKALLPVSLIFAGMAAGLYLVSMKSRAITLRLAGSEARLELALATAKAGAFEIDLRAKTFWCSPRTVEILGRRMTYADAATRPWTCIHPEDQVTVSTKFEAPMAADLKENDDEVRIVRPDGSIRWVRISIQCDTDRWADAGRVTGMIQDIDERKLQELALVEAQRAAHAAAEAKSRFLATVSHEIRTPMNGILGVLHLLKSQTLTPDAEQLLGEALACGEMLTGLIGDVLDFSKIEAGQLELVPIPTDPVAALQGVAGLLRPQCVAKGISLTVTTPADLGWVSVDPVRLRQSLFNLVGNAVKFTAVGGVHVRLTQPTSDSLRFEIMDTGVGIPEAAKAGMFEQFNQGDSSTTRKFGGTGLGLAITRRLARMMGGDVSFVSRQGQGSTFWLDLHAPATDAPAAAVEDTAALRPLRVLVVEDNPTNRLIATRLLETIGLSVETAENGQVGVEAAARGGFDIILMDVQMPVMDGLEATRRIRAMGGPTAATPIIALTANAMTHQSDAYLAAGMDGLVAKPISPPALLAEIARLTQEPAESPLRQTALAS